MHNRRLVGFGEKAAGAQLQQLWYERIVTVERQNNYFYAGIRLPRQLQAFEDLTK